jgi:choline kinase
VDYDNAYSLWLGLEGIHSDELLLIDGDIFCEKEILKEFIDYPHRDVLLARPAANADEMGGKIYLSEGFVKVIGERLPIEYYPWKIYSGIARLSMETYQKLRTVLLNVHKIVDAFNIISCETKIRVMQPSLNNDISYYGWININTPDDYKTLLEKFEDI